MEISLLCKRFPLPWLFPRSSQCSQLEVGNMYSWKSDRIGMTKHAIDRLNSPMKSRMQEEDNDITCGVNILLRSLAFIHLQGSAVQFELENAEVARPRLPTADFPLPGFGLLTAGKRKDTESVPTSMASTRVSVRQSIPCSENDFSMAFETSVFSRQYARHLDKLPWCQRHSEIGKLAPMAPAL